MNNQLALLQLTLCAFCAGFSLAWLLCSVAYRRRQRRVLERVERVYQEAAVAHHELLLAPAILRTRQVALTTEVPRWEAQR